MRTGNRSIGGLVLVLALGACSTTAFAGKKEPLHVKLNEEFELSIGQKAEIIGEGLTVSLKKLGENPTQGGPTGGGDVSPIAVATLEATKNGRTMREQVPRGQWLSAHKYLVYFNGPSKKPGHVNLSVSKE